MPTTDVQAVDASPGDIPVVPVTALGVPLGEDALKGLRLLLPEHLRSRRWFRSKAREIQEVSIPDVIALGPAVLMLVLNISYNGGGPADTYLLPLILTDSVDDAVVNAAGAEPLAFLRDASGTRRLLSGAFSDGGFRGLLLRAIAEERSFSGTQGSFAARRIASAAAVPIDPTMDSIVSRAEQSNTSVIYQQDFILKLFRKIESGLNPDIEIGAFLTENGFRNTPAVLGTLEYHRDGEAPFSAGLLQRFVPNRGDAWRFTLTALGQFFDRVLGQTGVAKQPELLQPYRQSAELLGQRTAEMHAVLAGGRSSDFAPESVSAADAQQLAATLESEADHAFHLLRDKAETLPAAAAALVRQLLDRETAVRQRFDALRDRSFTAQRIRFHGDYHLGQVLATQNGDFMIIDFEGEPARPLEERRAKALALRDVAGMVRSFQYAAYAALFGQIDSPALRAADAGTVEDWAGWWYEQIATAYTRSYFEFAGAASFVPASEDERRLLLDVFLLQKALYEIGYELNNRPAWVQIPLRGVLSLLN